MLNDGPGAKNYIRTFCFSFFRNRMWGKFRKRNSHFCTHVKQNQKTLHACGRTDRAWVRSPPVLAGGRAGKGQCPLAFDLPSWAFQRQVNTDCLPERGWPPTPTPVGHFFPSWPLDGAASPPRPRSRGSVLLSAHLGLGLGWKEPVSSTARVAGGHQPRLSASARASPSLWPSR